MTSDNIIYSLLHEVGHIVLGHLNKECVNIRLLDMQADAFAYEVLNNESKRYVYINFSVVFLALLWFFVGIYNTNQNTNLSKHETVYITSTGIKYHRNNCIYVNEKNCSALSIEQAKKNYTPCKVCNP